MKIFTKNLSKLNDKEILDDDDITTYLLGNIKHYQNIIKKSFGIIIYKIFETNFSFHMK